MHVAVAAYLGLAEGARRAAPRRDRDSAVAELQAMTGRTGGTFVPPIPIRKASNDG